jgi:hypothetical protein
MPFLFFPACLKTHPALPRGVASTVINRLKGGNVMQLEQLKTKVRLKKAQEVKVPVLLEEVRGYIAEGELKTFIALCSLVRKKLKKIPQLAHLWGEKDYKKILDNLWFCRIFTHGIIVYCKSLCNWYT